MTNHPAPFHYSAETRNCIALEGLRGEVVLLNCAVEKALEKALITMCIIVGQKCFLRWVKSLIGYSTHEATSDLANQSPTAATALKDILAVSADRQ